MIFDMHVIVTEAALSSARRYLEVVEQGIPVTRQRELEALRQRARENNWDWDEYSPSLSAVTDHFDNVMPQYLSYSFIVLLQGIIESRLVDLAKRMMRDRGISPPERWPRERAVSEEAKRFLTRHANLPVGTDPSWAVLRNIGKLRNLIVHRGGACGEEGEWRDFAGQLIRLYPGHVRFSHIGFGDDGSAIAVSLDLCRRFVDEVESFFRRQFDQLGMVAFDEEGSDIMEDDNG